MDFRCLKFIFFNNIIGGRGFQEIAGSLIFLAGVYDQECIMIMKRRREREGAQKSKISNFSHGSRIRY